MPQHRTSGCTVIGLLKCRAWERAAARLQCKDTKLSRLIAGSLMTFEGDQDFPLGPAELWPRLRDARFLVDCIPDAIVQGEPQPARGQCTVRPGFAFVRGSLD